LVNVWGSFGNMQGSFENMQGSFENMHGNFENRKTDDLVCAIGLQII